jgi:predicted hydrocarbon binding protein
LQDIYLSNDDGAAEDDESALVLAAKAAGPAAGQDGGRNRRRVHGWIMTEAHIGRVVAACLHQAIAEQLPQRLEFYEHWLASEELRDGAIGLAPFTAVVGFLRTEGVGYERVVERAGVLAASWSLETLTPFRRRSIGWLPRPLRLRAALRAASSIVRTVSRTSRTRARIAGDAAKLEVDPSLFCAVRGASEVPLCGFYAALVVETLRQFNIGATGRLETCRSMGAPVCVILLDVSLNGAVPPAVAA